MHLKLLVAQYQVDKITLISLFYGKKFAIFLVIEHTLTARDLFDLIIKCIDQF